MIRPAARALVVVAALIITLGCAHAEHPEIAKRRAAERKTFTDAEIYKGLFLTAFGAEMSISGRVDGIRKYVVPVRVFVENRAEPAVRLANLGRIVNKGHQFRTRLKETFQAFHNVRMLLSKFTFENRDGTEW